MAEVSSSFSVGIHFENILRAISEQIYETPHAFIRENVQNAVDAVRIQALRDSRQTTDEQYKIQINVNDRVVEVRDNGIGMSRAQLENYFWTIGASGKRDQEAHDAGCVGMFGIGGFANFGVCEALEVISQTEKETIGTRTSLSARDIEQAGTARPAVAVDKSELAGPRGTLIVGHMKQPPNVDDLKTYLQSFVRYVPISVQFNGEEISRQAFTTVARSNLTPLKNHPETWSSENITIVGSLFEDLGHTLVAAIEDLFYDGEQTNLTGQLRFENGSLDVFKRGFKLCTTQVPSTIGLSGRLDCDLFVPTAGRDSLDAGTTSLLSQIGQVLENIAIDAIFDSPDRIAQNTRVFRLVVQRGLIDKMHNVYVRLADGDEKALDEIRRRAEKGEVGVFFGTTQRQALNQVMHARGHIVVQLSADRYRKEAEKRYLEAFCAAKPFDGLVDCAEVYGNLSRFEHVFLSEVEQNISRSYEITNFKLIAGRLTEDIPTFVKEHSGGLPIEIFIDVRHGEVTKLESLGLNPLMYSLISIFCREYIGPSLKKWSPRFFGNGALNLARFARNRSELWVLVKDDISVVRRKRQPQVVTQDDVRIVRIGEEQSQAQPVKNQTHRLLRILDDEGVTDMAGFYIRLPDRACRAYGDLLGDCDNFGVVWAGNRLTFVASDGINAQFQYDIRLDEIVSVEVNGKPRAEGALDLERRIQEMYDGVYFPIPIALERFLVPAGDRKIRLDLHCEWIELGTSNLWATDA